MQKIQVNFVSRFVIKSLFGVFRPSQVVHSLLEQRQSQQRKKNDLLVAWSRNSPNLTVVRTNDSHSRSSGASSDVARDQTVTDIVQT